MTDKRAAVIDLGTNTFHLLIVDLHSKGFELLFKEKAAVKIGEGGINRNQLTEPAQKRAFHTLRHFKNLIDGEKITQVYVFATSAIRNAENGQSFVEEVKQRFEFNVNVIDGENEAELIYEGIKFSGSLNEKPSLMMDIGGGSVEFIIGNHQESLWKQSFEIGGQRLLDLFSYHDPILPAEIEKLHQFFDQQLKSLADAIQRLKPGHFVGASGTFDTLTDMYYASCQLPKEKGQSNFILPRPVFEKMVDQLISLNKADRLKIPGMIPMRVEMIVVAVCLIRHVLTHFQSSDLICSTYALKEGVIARLVDFRASLLVS